MSEIRPEAGNRGTFQVSGDLVFETVPELLEQGRALLDTGVDAGVTGIELDFNGVTRADSAGLALLIEWMRSARRLRLNIVFRNVPEQMLAIARVSGVDGILPLARQSQ
jgi:phospholipid transport system transporter-binding protein